METSSQPLGEHGNVAYLSFRVRQTKGPENAELCRVLVDTFFLLQWCQQLYHATMVPSLPGTGYFWTSMQPVLSNSACYLHSGEVAKKNLCWQICAPFHNQCRLAFCRSIFRFHRVPCVCWDGSTIGLLSTTLDDVLVLVLRLQCHIRILFSIRWYLFIHLGHDLKRQTFWSKHKGRKRVTRGNQPRQC